MILRRITKLLREQNWFAVVLELVVVVVGIVLGLQFTDWNESRKERALEAYYLAQLDRDFIESLAYWDGLLEQMERQASSSVSVAQFLLDQTLSEQNRAQFDEDWVFLFGWLHLNFYQATLDELRDTGRLTLIRSDELRRELVQFSTFLQIQQTYNENVGHMLMEFFRDISEVTRMKPGTFELLSTNQELLDDDRVYAHVSQIAIYHGIILNEARKAYAEAQILHQLLLNERARD